jgi:glucose/arabinose dehydrogenase
LFADGLYEGLGLAVVKGDIYVLQRTELSRLRDTDGDGRCDTIDTISDDWGVSGNYHEFAYGLPHDADGNFYVSLNVGFLDPKWWHGKSLAPWRWARSVNESDVHASFRSPNGLGFNGDGDLFATDNQGDWMPSCPLFHVKAGEFYGHPASLEWTDEYKKIGKKASDTDPPTRQRRAPAVWIPYGLSRSAGNPLSRRGSSGRSRGRCSWPSSPTAASCAPTWRRSRASGRGARCSFGAGRARRTGSRSRPTGR